MHPYSRVGGDGVNDDILDFMDEGLIPPHLFQGVSARLFQMHLVDVSQNLHGNSQSVCVVFASKWQRS